MYGLAGATQKQWRAELLYLIAHRIFQIVGQLPLLDVKCMREILRVKCFKIEVMR
jgi:hypothetical protein